jgi:hypothetical protein
MKKSLLLLLLFTAGIFAQNSTIPLTRALNKDTKIAVFSDTHLHLASLGITGQAFQDYLASDRKLIAESEPILKSAISIVKSENPDILLVPGDLTKDGEKINHEKFAEYLRDIEKSGIKVFVVPGNHDINNPESYSYSGNTKTKIDNISAADFKSIYAEFGYNEAIYKDANSVSYIAEPVSGVWLFAMDACRYAENTNKSVTAGKFSSATFSWIKEKLVEAKKKGKIAVGMMHHGIVEHYTGQKATFPEYVVDDYDIVSNMFAQNGMRVVFTGHYHANDITLKNVSTGELIYDVETGSLVTSPCPVRFVTIKPTLEAVVTTKYIQQIEFDTKGKTFPEYAGTYLYDGMKNLVFTQLTAPVSYGGYGVSAEQANAVSPLLAGAFVAHYKGDEKIDAQTLAIVNTLITSTDPTTKLLGQSVYSLFSDLLPADNNTTLDLKAFSAISANPKVLLEKNGAKIYNGGFGSALAFNPNEPGYYYMLTDRGPNTDATTSDKKVFPVPSFNPQIGKFKLYGDTLKLESAISLKDSKGNKLTGLPNLPNSGGTGEIAIDLDGTVLPNDSLGIDPEGMVLIKDGTFWTSDEYGPHLIHFDAQGNTLERINPFSKTKALPKVLALRRANRGMEGLAVTPDGKFLVGMMQSPLYNPNKDAVKNSLVTRLIVYEIATGNSKQYIYPLETTSTANSEITAIDDKTFLVLERDGDFLYGTTKSLYKSIYKISIAKATDVSDPANGINGKLFGTKTIEELNDPKTLISNGIIPVEKKLVINLVNSGYQHDKAEGLTIIDNNTIAISNDDDFGIASNGANGFTSKIVPTADQATSFIDYNEIYFVHFTTPISLMPTDVKKYSNEIPAGFNLEQNYPNPFNPSTVISYKLSTAAHVSLKVYDMLGREVATLVNEFQQPGSYNFQFIPGAFLRNNSQLSSGVYFYTLNAGDYTNTKKMLLMK